MTCSIFEEWMMMLDKYFTEANRKVIFFVDNCPLHPKSLKQKLNSIRLEFFPPNMTSRVQPLYMGIIKNIKHFYRSEIVKKKIEEINNNSCKPMSLLESINLIAKVWTTNVKQETIVNCFKKCGFEKLNNIQNEQGHNKEKKVDYFAENDGIIGIQDEELCKENY